MCIVIFPMVSWCASALLYFVVVCLIGFGYVGDFVSRIFLLALARERANRGVHSISVAHLYVMHKICGCSRLFTPDHHPFTNDKMILGKDPKHVSGRTNAYT